MTALTAKPDHGASIIQESGDSANSVLQRFFDELEQILNDEVLVTALKLQSYTVTTVPAASAYTAHMIYVSDETGGAVPAFSDGVDWRRCTDRAVIS